MKRALIVAAAVVMGWTGNAISAESVVPITPPGATDLSQALLPPPGLYGALVGIPYNQNSHFYDRSGHQVPPSQDVQLSVPTVAAAFLYIYPLDIFGGHVASSIVVPFNKQDYNIGSGAIRGQNVGLEDLYSDVLFYSKNVGLLGVTPGSLPLPYGLTVAGGLAVKIPVGQYSASIPINSGSNVFVTVPNVALTYTTGPNMSLGDSTELSARIFYGFVAKNPATGYQSGDIFNIDFSASQRFGAFRIGVTGSYQEQTTSDYQLSGVPVPNGGRYKVLPLGPVIEYAFSPTVIAKLKYEKVLLHDNFVDQGIVALSLAFKL